MTAMWPLSRIPQFDASGDPLVGAQAFFYDPGTTSPQTTYSDAGLSVANANPVLADGNGRFPAVYLSPTPGQYRQRVLDADGSVIFDDDAVSVPQSADYVPPSAGTTDPTLLHTTGDLKDKHGTGAEAGWVRANGRSIGNASSGASERANADTQALFQYLWNGDTALTVSGGRGSTALGDYAANKTIALPDYRNRARVGLGDMGNSDNNLIPDSLVDGGKNNTTLGATVGAATVTLTTSQMPSHNHAADPPAATTSPNTHNHAIPIGDDGGNYGNDAVAWTDRGRYTGQPSPVTDNNTHNHTVDIPAFNTANTGGGAAHTNMPPSKFCTVYIKL